MARSERAIQQDLEFLSCLIFNASVAQWKSDVFVRRGLSVRVRPLAF